MYIISFDNGRSLLYTLLEEVAEETAAAICAHMKTDVKVSRGGQVVHEFFTTKVGTAVFVETADMLCVKDKKKPCPDDASCCLVHD